LDEVELKLSENDIKPIKLTPSMIVGEWLYIRYNQDGCEEYLEFPENNIFTYIITAGPDSTFYFTDAEKHTGRIMYGEDLVFERIYNDEFTSTRSAQLILARQAHPTEALAGLVFQGPALLRVFAIGTTVKLCEGHFEFFMVKKLAGSTGTTTNTNTNFNYTCVRAAELRKRYNECMQDNFYADCYSLDRDAKLVEGQCNMSK
jgi:hypothetical protein